jgi:hypothetical protein
MDVDRVVSIAGSVMFLLLVSHCWIFVGNLTEGVSPFI